MKSPTLEQTRAVAPLEEAIQSGTQAFLQHRGRWMRRFLHGSWLGHPLHAAITDFPIGALTISSALDAAGPRYQNGADAALRVGLISAGVAATAGVADWSRIDQPARRVGLFHALFNVSATGCYVASWLLRRRGARTAGVSTGFVGWLLLMAGAYLGGTLVYKHRIGVDHAQRQGPLDFVPVLPEEELFENQPRRVDCHGNGVLLIKQEGRIYAIGERCAHLGGPLAEGTLGRLSIKCPWHGSTYSLETGKVLDGPSAYAQPCYQVRIQDGQIQVRTQNAKALVP